ncbi:MAG: porin [Alphaproteobacteria bacterium]|nr:porin [Alphaproteobacteria bacterium]
MNKPSSASPLASRTCGAIIGGCLLASAAAPSGWAADGDTPPADWLDTVKLSGHIEAGITGNPASPSDGLNFGYLFTDRANTPLMNQLMLTAERPLDPKATGYDFGFKLQGMYGSDARYTHGFNELDRVIGSRYQVDIVEANGVVHLPWLTEGGIDAKIGQFSSPMSAEVIDATGNIFYSHSYIFNFGVPFKNTGILTTTHVNPIVDLYAGADTGVNAWVGAKGDNNSSGAGQFGIGLNLMGGNLTILGLSHIGPENPNDNHDLRYVNDITATLKLSDALTLITDVNYIRDDGLHAIGYGAAQYVAYTLDDHWSLAARGEIWRDNAGAFVAAFPGNLDFINSERGLAPATVISGGRTTYGELTLGVNYKPEVPKMIEGFVIRPELRFDEALNGTTPFNAGTSSHQVTLATDFVLPF